MEKNLPFVSIPFLDKVYAKFIIPILKKLDEGIIFKDIITVLLSLSALALLVGGVYLSIFNMFGEQGYIKDIYGQNPNYGNLNELQKISSGFGLVIGFALSILTSWVLYSFLKKRTEQLREMDYNGLLDFVFNKTIPKLILIIGEIIFLLFLYVGVLQILATLLGAYVYAPLQKFPGLILTLFPGMEVFDDFLPRAIYGNHDNFVEYFKIGIIGVVSSFVVLIAFYLYKEVYTYLLKLITAFIEFLPKFAIPLAIRKRNEN
jgi:hypothetical protein